MREKLKCRVCGAEIPDADVFSTMGSRGGSQKKTISEAFRNAQRDRARLRWEKQRSLNISKD